MTALAAPLEPAPRHEELVEDRLILWYYYMALTFLTISMLAGILMAFQLIKANPLSGIELFSPGRWRMLHTNAIAYGFLANAFLERFTGRFRASHSTPLPVANCRTSSSSPGSSSC